MSIPLIRAAFEKRLSLLLPALPTAYENAPFVPVTGVAYQRVNLLPATPDNSTMGSAVYRELGIFQITLCYPLNTGPASAEAKAEALRAHFRRGTSMLEGAITTVVMDTPKISPALIDGDRYCIPISVSWQAQINTP